MADRRMGSIGLKIITNDRSQGMQMKIVQQTSLTLRSSFDMARDGQNSFGHLRKIFTDFINL